MKILFLNSIDADTYGGMEEWIRLVATGLNARGHQITICGRKNSQFLKRLAVDDIRLELVGLDISGDFNPLTIASIKRIIEQRNVETVIVNFNKDIRLGGIAAKLADEVTVIWSVGLNITKDNLAHKILTPRLIHGVIVPSQALKNQITSLGHIRPEIVKVIPIGITKLAMPVSKEKARESLSKKFSLRADSTICVTCGRFVEQKGHKFLIDAASEIVTRHPHVVFLLLGDGPLRRKLEKRIADLKIENYFIFAGMVENVSALLPGCDLMIHPSIEEPFG
ncbi:MAG: glycosyltransferase, partial [Candidatus Zixiibacteriota bacterium]